MADKLTPDNKKLAKMVQKIGSIDKKAPKKPASKSADTKPMAPKKAATKKPTIIEPGNKSGKMADINGVVKAINRSRALKSGTPTGQSAKSHQKNLANIAGVTAIRNTKNKSTDIQLANSANAKKRTEKSFKKSK